MSRVSRIAAAMVWAVLALTLAMPGAAFAHEHVTVGKYELTIGWVEEPPLVGEPNGISLRITDTETNQPVSDVDTLRLSLTTGDQTRELELEPLGERAPGQYAADVIPTVRGVYSVRITGKIAEQDVDVSVDIEEVAEADSLQFPVILPSSPKMNEELSSLRAENQSLRASVAQNQLLAAGGAVLGLSGLVAGLVSLRRK